MLEPSVITVLLVVLALWCWTYFIRYASPEAVGGGCYGAIFVHSMLVALMFIKGYTYGVDFDFVQCDGIEGALFGVAIYCSFAVCTGVGIVVSALGILFGAMVGAEGFRRCRRQVATYFRRCVARIRGES